MKTAELFLRNTAICVNVTKKVETLVAIDNHYYEELFFRILDKISRILLIAI
jgi:hypothetical protein